MQPDRMSSKKQHWFDELRLRWNEFTGEIFGHIAQQEAKISREEFG
jgi:hypothetical protein